MSIICKLCGKVKENGSAWSSMVSSGLSPWFVTSVSLIATITWRKCVDVDAAGRL